MKEGRGPIFLDLQNPLQRGWQDPAASTDHLTPKGKRKPLKRGPADPNWAYNQIQDHANDILPDGLPERGPNSGNIDDRNKRREESRDL